MLTHIEVVSFGSEKYKTLLKLRNEVLRNPFGLALSDKDTESDNIESHIAMFEQDIPIGCLLLRPISRNIIKLRQMAVSDAYQGKGVGASLVRYAEQVAIARGFKRIEMHARKSAQGFYEKCGYSTEGGEFIEVTVPHIKMHKNLSGLAI